MADKNKRLAIYAQFKIMKNFSTQSAVIILQGIVPKFNGNPQKWRPVLALYSDGRYCPLCRIGYSYYTFTGIEYKSDFTVILQDEFDLE